MNRLLACVVAGAALLSAVACTAEGGPSRLKPSPGASSTRTASPRATTAGRGQAVDASRANLTAQLSLKDLPGPHGMFTAAVGRSAATFVWESSDGRFCSGSAAMAVGFTSTSCLSDRRDAPFAVRPALVPLLSTYTFAEVHVFGADRETVRSVTCNGRPLAVRRLPRVLDGRRVLYAFDLSEPTAGRVTVTVVRGRVTATEHVELMGGDLRHKASCR
ncbi:hypothetical protein ABZT43_39805 [Streptomyces sp. NPDC005349]|uniref:hypothetical protein n=1 Tax=Streptomyces sp. NPDC005349 TaxID=3157037 RepID=UPI0033AEB71C